MKNLLTLIKDRREKLKACDISKKKVYEFFVNLVVMYLIGWLYFFLIAINLIVDLATGRAMLIEKKVIVGFFGLFF